mmetsp:Transcript_18693/g.48500  ORF Transcript_18693/g.48500 Transcript_18693/m.48500 type:complete len:233 (-) Transcript_18693:409-1107(-)
MEPHCGGEHCGLVVQLQEPRGGLACRLLRDRMQPGLSTRALRQPSAAEISRVGDGEQRGLSPVWSRPKIPRGVMPATCEAHSGAQPAIHEWVLVAHDDQTLAERLLLACCLAAVQAPHRDVTFSRQCHCTRTREAIEATVVGPRRLLRKKKPNLVALVVPTLLHVYSGLHPTLLKAVHAFSLVYEAVAPCLRLARAATRAQRASVEDCHVWNVLASGASPAIGTPVTHPVLR